MKKIPTIFKRNPANMKLVTEEKNPVCDWVFNGEGVATVKFDGTCVMIEKGKYFKRRTVKKNKKFPPDFIPVDFDPITGKNFGWVPVDPSDPSNKYHMEAFEMDYSEIFSYFNNPLKDGTYELCGPSIQGNPCNSPIHFLIAHADAPRLARVPREFDGLKEWFVDKCIEGIVFHHKDGRMAKIKMRDFGLLRSGNLE